MDVIRGRIPGIQIRENHGFYTYMHRGITTLRGNDKADGMPKSSAELFLGESFSDVPPLFLLNGVIYDAPRDDSSPLMHIPVQEIDKIEYLVNEGTSLFGARAAGGVISIFTKRGNTIIDTPSKLSNITLKGFESFKTKDTEEKPNDATLWIPSFRLSNNVTFDAKIPKMTDRKIVITIEGITDEGGTPISLKKIVEMKK